MESRLHTGEYADNLIGVSLSVVLCVRTRLVDRFSLYYLAVLMDNIVSMLY